MKQVDFAELVESIKEGASILREEKEASRAFHLETDGIKDVQDGNDLPQD